MNMFKGSVLAILFLVLVAPQRSYAIDDRYITECGALTAMTHAVNAPYRGGIEGYAIGAKGRSKAKIVTSAGYILGLINNSWQAVEGLEHIDDANGITELGSDNRLLGTKRGDVFVSRDNDVIEQYRINKDHSYSLAEVFDLVTTVPVEDLVSGYPFARGSIGVFDGSNIYQASISGSQILVDDANPIDISALLSDLTGNVLALDCGNRKTVFAIDEEKLSQLKLNRVQEVRGIRYGELLPDWTSGPSLNTARLNHTATRLDDGRILVVGGFNHITFNDLSSAEIYDPVTDSWSSAGNLSFARSGVHTATLLQDGRVLVVGGFNHIIIDVLSSAEIYDPVTNTWSTTGSLSTARGHHTSTLLSDGRVLVIGGSDLFSIHSSVEIYDPASGTWSDASSLNDARQLHSANLLPDGRILVAGGYDPDWWAEPPTVDLASAELYDPVTETWSYTSSLTNSRGWHTATLLGDGNVLVTGGFDHYYGFPAEAELYDPVTETWSNAGSIADERMVHTATLLPSGKVLVTGGGNLNGNLASTELYDPVTNTWSSTGSLDRARGYHTSTLLTDGRVLVTGGYVDDSQGPLSSVELYYPAP